MKIKRIVKWFLIVLLAYAVIGGVYYLYRSPSAADSWRADCLFTPGGTSPDGHRLAVDGACRPDTLPIPGVAVACGHGTGINCHFGITADH